MTAIRKRTVIIGIGNPDRGDDGAGRAVARRLRGTLPPGIEILEHNGEAASLLACIEGAPAAYLIDACASGAPPGTVRRFDVGGAPLQRGIFGVSTHDLGVAEAVEIARILGRLPAHCIVYAIEGGSFMPGALPSPPVAVAVEQAARQIRGEFCGAGPPVTRGVAPDALPIRPAQRQ